MSFVHVRLYISGADPGFQVGGGGGALKKLRRAEGGAKNFGVFRVKNHDFTPGAPPPGSAPEYSIIFTKACLSFRYWNLIPLTCTIHQLS
jgi:hypothetical protein